CPQLGHAYWGIAFKTSWLSQTGCTETTENSSKAVSPLEELFLWGEFDLTGFAGFEDAGFKPCLLALNKVSASRMLGCSSKLAACYRFERATWSVSFPFHSWRYTRTLRSDR